jgi:AraC-like DNA-binding protein
MTSHRYQTRHEATHTLAGHRHRQPYLALVDAGVYVEYSADGAYRCLSGMAVVHPAFHSHSNHFVDRQARVTNIALSSAPRYEVFGLSDSHFSHAGGLEDAAELLDFVREEGAPVSASWGPAKVQAMAEQLGNDPCQRIDDLATSLKVSPEHAARLFRRDVGMTPAAIRSEHRLRKALRLLVRGQSGVDVAFGCGYSDQSHLCRSVRAATSRTITDLQQSDLFNTDTIDHR